MPIEGPALNAPFPLADLLSAGLEAGPDRPAVITRAETLSWAELDAQSERLAKNYLALGLSPGNRVGTLMPNRPALVVHHLACLKASLVSAPLNYRYMSPEIDHALEVSGASQLVHHVERDDDLTRCDTVPSLRLATVRYSDNAPDEQDGRSFADLLTTDPGVAVSLPPTRPESPLFVFFTSGSTGPAKGVTHTSETIGWMVATSCRASRSPRTTSC